MVRVGHPGIVHPGILGSVVTFPSSPGGRPRGVRCVLSARRPRPSYWTYSGLGAVRRECVHGAARQTGM
ncbi:putative membrane efflux protein [Streptomyces sp. Tu6071]|nr:putative membrane efflux protein [Streptomyces sp. Tu6071]